MCTSGQIIGSLLVLSVLEIGLGASSVAVGAVSFSLALREHKPQLGDSSPVQVGLGRTPGSNACVMPGVPWWAPQGTGCLSLKLRDTPG